MYESFYGLTGKPFRADVNQWKRWWEKEGADFRVPTSEELAKLQKGMPVLATVGSTAPFVGLFGTTFGVINAFQGMADAA